MMILSPVCCTMDMSIVVDDSSKIYPKSVSLFPAPLLYAAVVNLWYHNPAPRARQVTGSESEAEAGRHFTGWLMFISAV